MKRALCRISIFILSCIVGQQINAGSIISTPTKSISITDDIKEKMPDKLVTKSVQPKETAIIYIAGNRGSHRQKQPSVSTTQNPVSTTDVAVNISRLSNYAVIQTAQPTQVATTKTTQKDK